MRLRRSALSVALLVVAATASAQGVASPTLELARLQNGARSRRVSSYDRTGGNGDNVSEIASGTRRDIFDVKGAGVITHIWVTIAPAAPRAQPARRHPAHVLGRGDDAVGRGAHRRLLRAGLGRELPLRRAAAGRGAARGARDGQLLRHAVRHRGADRDRERHRADDRRVLLLRGLHGARGPARGPGPLPRLVQPRAHRGAAGGRERVVGARPAGEEHHRRAQLPDRGHRREGALRRRQLLRRQPQRRCGTARATTCSSSTASPGRPRCTAPAPRTTSTRPGPRTLSTSTPTSATGASPPGRAGWDAPTSTAST